MEGKPKPLVVVGLSGGVDSAVAAMLLLEQGYPVHGLFMKNWEDDDTAAHCTAEEDIADAKRVAAELGIPLHFANFARRYKEEVFARFLEEHNAGRTPNPDILCNSLIKFRAFPDYALRLGGEFVATGHYARKLQRKDGGVQLARGLDPNKDQSYFLHALTQTQLTRSLFPLGNLRKSDVRQLADEGGLHNFDRPDSTGICFIGERDFRSFLSRYVPARRGAIVSDSDQVLGEHMGIPFYTLGQRHGLGIGGQAGREGEPWFVAEKRLVDNTLVVVQGKSHPMLFKDTLAADKLHWIDGPAPRRSMRVTAKIRYRQADQPCRLVPGDNHWEVRFDAAQRAVTPGQSVVFYQGEVCLGGATIDRAWNRHAFDALREYGHG